MREAFRCHIFNIIYVHRNRETGEGVIFMHPDEVKDESQMGPDPMPSLSNLRLKMSVVAVKRLADGEGKITAEEIEMCAVYGAPGTVNNKWSKWTPNGRLTMTVSNPDVFGKVLPGQFIFVDLVPTTKDSSE